ncbi:hypothetical protein G4B84_000209, partial [Aspergillus flavus NRRL3357]
MDLLPLTGKRVGLIGNGSSGIQLLPELQSTNYLESLTKPNVKPVFGNIKEYNTVWRHYARRQRVCILCLGLGTGFQTSFRPAFPLTGRNDTNLAEPLANSPLIICIEAQEHYIAKFLNRWQKEDIRTFEPKLEAVDDFMEQKDLLMKSTIWENDCRSWFRKRQHRQGQWIVAWERAKLYRSRGRSA